MNSFKRKSILFSIGAVGYGLIEILWRGYTHWSMLCAGGLCFLSFGKISENMKRCSLFLKAITGGMFVTAIEFVFGLIFNIALKKNVWNYSNMPFNFLGQVCPLYSFIWTLLGFVFIPFAELVNKKIKQNFI